LEPSPTSAPIASPPDMFAGLLQRSEIIWIFFGIVALGLLILYLISTVPGQRQRSPRPTPRQREGVRRPISRHELVWAAAGLMLVVAAWSAVTVIEAGQRGVVFHLLSGVQGETLAEGTHILLPLLSRVTVYDMRPHVYDVRSASEQPERRSVRTRDPFLWTPTADGLKVGLDLSVRYRLDPTRLAELHRSVGPEVEEKVVHPIVWNVTRLVASEYSLLDIYGKRRSEIQQQVFDRVQAHFARDGLICEALLLQDVVYTEDFEKTLVTKMVAEQKVQESAFEVDQAALRARAQVIEARGEAQALAIINEVIRDQPLLLSYLWIRSLPERVKIIVVPPNRAGKAMPWGKRPSPEEGRVHAPGIGGP
ncbi:MAG: prohibitin family protein, partial [Candidatus Entotheonellia bacterium]